MFRIYKSIETESRLGVARGWEREKSNVLLMRIKFFLGDENILELKSCDFCTNLWLY